MVELVILAAVVPVAVAAGGLATGLVQQEQKVEIDL
jgi:hypothetical protein